MPASNLLLLIDDIATVLDDVAVMTKVAAKKTAGVLGDDLALNAEQVSGVSADRELPVVWAVGLGSLRNKLVLVPAALALSAVLPSAVTPLLMLGGAFLCFEGFEKIAHRLFHPAEEDAAAREAHVAALADPGADLVALEREKIRGAVRTDFVLSAEVIVIALGTVASAPLVQRLAVLAAVGLIMTVGVYGLVAGIVKLDDLGRVLARGGGKARRAVGAVILRAAPLLMRGLSLAGTVAMFLVGGGILSHGAPPLHRAIEAAAHAAGPAAALVGPVLEGLAGVVAGGLLVLAWTGLRRLRRRRVSA